jgi:hypothetical protein
LMKAGEIEEKKLECGWDEMAALRYLIVLA